MFAESPFAAWLTPKIRAHPAKPLSAALVRRLTVPPEKSDFLRVTAQSYITCASLWSFRAQNKWLSITNGIGRLLDCSRLLTG